MTLTAMVLCGFIVVNVWRVREMDDNFHIDVVCQDVCGNHGGAWWRCGGEHVHWKVGPGAQDVRKESLLDALSGQLAAVIFKMRQVKLLEMGRRQFTEGEAREQVQGMTASCVCFRTKTPSPTWWWRPTPRCSRSTSTTSRASACGHAGKHPRLAVPPLHQAQEE